MRSGVIGTHLKGPVFGFTLWGHLNSSVFLLKFTNTGMKKKVKNNYVYVTISTWVGVVNWSINGCGQFTYSHVYVLASMDLLRWQSSSLGKGPGVTSGGNKASTRNFQFICAALCVRSCLSSEMLHYLQCNLYQQ